MIDDTFTSNADRETSLFWVPITQSETNVLALTINSKVHRTIGAESTLLATSADASISDLCSTNEILILSKAPLDLHVLP